MLSPKAVRQRKEAVRIIDDKALELPHAVQVDQEAKSVRAR
jgi:hypothetical protein